jgi:hypothetical protein
VSASGRKCGDIVISRLPRFPRFCGFTAGAALAKLAPMSILRPLAGLLAGLLLTACAASPGPESARTATQETAAPEQAVEAYFAYEGLPAGWRLDSVTTRDEDVLVIVGLSDRLWAYERALPGRAKPAFFSAICPALHHPVWELIGRQKDIVIEARDRPQASFHVSCREHAPTGA